MANAAGILFTDYRQTMTLRVLYTGMVLMAEIASIFMAYHLPTENSVPAFMPLLMTQLIFLAVMTMAHIFRLRSYLYRHHPEIWKEITDYSSFLGSFTHNIPALEKLVRSDAGNLDQELQARKTLIRRLYILVPTAFMLMPLDALLVFVFYYIRH